MERITLKTRRKIGYFVGVFVVLLVITGLFLPQSMILHANGPSNIGHEDLKCADCHKEEVGSLRQRLQANVRFILGLRSQAVSFGLKPVINDECVYCHERPNDRHPVYRFFEPKYKKIQVNIQPQFCTSCHLEHTGRRVTSGMVFCQNCHEKLTLKNDPVTKTHQEIILNKDWESCLGCHDYHGNHKMKVNTKFNNKISKNTIQLYFEYRESPYSKEKFYQVQKQKLGG